MATRYPLTLAEDYVDDWGIVEAIRELFQNAIDNQTTNPENEMYFNYDKDTKILRIGNKTSCLPRKSLLLGGSTKKNDAKTIGKHGEGYKLAFMILLRNSKTIVAYNYGAREVWNTKLVKSKNYDYELVPYVLVEKVAVWNKVPSHDLMLEIGGITEEEYAEIVESNLHLQSVDEEEVVTNEIGSRILLNPKYRGKIFVKGLYINSNPGLNYGYDFAPDVINLDRDRKLVDSFNLSWQTSSLWQRVVTKKRDLYLELVKADAMDTKYVTDVYTGTEDKEVKNMAFEDFVEEHGEDSVPVSTQDELKYAMSVGKRPVMLPKAQTNIIRTSEKYEEVAAVKILSPKEALAEWFEEVKGALTVEEVDKFNVIYARL